MRRWRGEPCSLKEARMSPPSTLVMPPWSLLASTLRRRAFNRRHARRRRGYAFSL